MKKLKVGIIFFIAVISCALLGTNKVAAAYSRGSRVTTSKVLRGTWYTYDYGRGLNKMKITSHTITLPFLGKQVPHGTYTLYQQDKTFFDKSFKYQKRASKYASDHHWMASWKYRYQGHEYLGIDPFWLDLGDNDFGGGLRVTSVTKDGRKLKQLILKNPNSVRRFYQSRSIAKLMK